MTGNRNNYQGYSPPMAVQTQNPAPCTVLGSGPRCPFPSLNDSIGSPAGLYWFVLNDTVAQLYADGTGFILIKAGFGPLIITPPIITRPGVVVPNAHGQFDRGTVVALANIVSTVEMRCAERSEWVRSSHAYVLDRLRNYMSFDTPGGSFTGSTQWTGNAVGRLNRTCASSTYNHTFEQSQYHACGNGTGVHWMTTQRSFVSDTIGQNLTVWVKA